MSGAQPPATVPPPSIETAPPIGAMHAGVLRILIVFGPAAAIVGLGLLISYQGAGFGAAPEPLADIQRLVFVGLVAVAAFAISYGVLAHGNRRAAEAQSERETRMLRDEIETHVRTNAELQRARNAAEAANLAKSRYIIGVSHEIRSPLNTISGYAQLLEREAQSSTADAVRVIRQSATHLADLVDGLVDVSRIENGSVRIARERVNLVELVQQLADMFRIQAAARGIHFEHSRPPKLPPYVYGDEKRLRQILINLLSNAIKYTPSGSAALNIYWRNPIAEFEVKDTGVGIKPEDLDRIFEPFERIEAVRGQPGVGLGLSITRLLVDIMGGEITVESRPGIGSTFRVKMFFSDAPAPKDGARPDPRERRYRGLRRRILVVDDDSAHLDLLHDLLMPIGFDLAFAANGAAGLEAYALHPPDLVLMDIAMPPGIDGWETARSIRREHGDATPILMVSANAHDFQRQRRPDDPHDDYLIKPYEIEELLDRIGLLLDLDWVGGGGERKGGR